VWIEDCLKDLQRFLRQDDPVTREAFFEIGRKNIIKTDLIPLIMGYVDDLDVVYNARKPPYTNAPTQHLVAYRSKLHKLSAKALHCQSSIVFSWPLVPGTRTCLSMFCLACINTETDKQLSVTVKVATFMTMPLEQESKFHSAQVTRPESKHIALLQQLLEGLLGEG
jgi:Timeless protein